MDIVKKTVLTITHKSIEQQVEKALLEALLCFKQEKNVTAKTLCVALSGGVDSIVLLNIVHRLIQTNKLTELKLEAFHVDHGISQFSGSWRDFCQKMCLEKDIPFFTTELKLEKTKQRSLEADARDARYQALCAHAKRHTMVLLGQHQSDQAETFLLQLRRGSGIAGLASMPLFMLKRDVAFARPLLAVSKQAVIEFASLHKLKWCEDNSNTDESFDRNFLRHSVLPVLQKRWPHINSTVSRVADNCALALEVNNEYMALLAKSIKQENTIDLEKLSQYSDATKQAFLQYCLFEFYNKQLSKVQLESLLALCDVVKKESAYQNFDDVVVERFQNKLVMSQLTEYQLDIVKKTSSTHKRQAPTFSTDLSEHNVVRIDPNTELVFISGSEHLELKSKALIKQTEENSSLYFIDQKWCERNHVIVLPDLNVDIYIGASNLKFKYRLNRPTKALKSWFQEWQVTPIQRKFTSVITANSQVCAVLTFSIKGSVLKVPDALNIDTKTPVFAKIIKYND